MFAFGDAPFLGGAASQDVGHRFVGMTRSRTGYRLLAESRQPAAGR